MDHLVWAALTIFKHCLHVRHMRFTLKSGKELAAAVHDDWANDCSMRATALDLKKCVQTTTLEPAGRKQDCCDAQRPSRWPGEVLSYAYAPIRIVSIGCCIFNRVSWLLWGPGMPTWSALVVLLRRLSYTMPKGPGGFFNGGCQGYVQFTWISICGRQTGTSRGQSRISGCRT